MPERREDKNRERKGVFKKQYTEINSQITSFACLTSQKKSFSFSPAQSSIVFIPFALLCLRTFRILKFPRKYCPFVAKNQYLCRDKAIIGHENSIDRIRQDGQDDRTDCP